MSITRPVGIAAAHAYTGADGEQVELYFVRGGGLDGKLVQPFDRSEEYDYVADDPAVVRAVLSGDVFTIETGGVDLPPKAVPLSMLVQAASS